MSGGRTPRFMKWGATSDRGWADAAPFKYLLKWSVANNVYCNVDVGRTVWVVGGGVRPGAVSVDAATLDGLD